MRRTGVEGKQRFTLKYPNGDIQQYGTCNSAEDERMSIRMTESPIQNNEGGTEYIKQYWLVKHQKDSYELPERERTLLPDGTLIANGYYEKEWDEFVSPEEWLNQN